MNMLLLFVVTLINNFSGTYCLFSKNEIIYKLTLKDSNSIVNTYLEFWIVEPFIVPGSRLLFLIVFFVNFRTMRNLKMMLKSLIWDLQQFWWHFWTQFQDWLVRITTRKCLTFSIDWILMGFIPRLPWISLQAVSLRNKRKLNS